jgi:integrase
MRPWEGIWLSRTKATKTRISKVDSKGASSRTREREAENSRETGVIKAIRVVLRVRGRVVVRVARADKVVRADRADRVVRADRAVETDSSSAEASWMHAGSPLFQVRSHVKSLLIAAKLPNIRLHDLRHCATSLLAQGVSPRVVMETLGHSQVSLTLNTDSHVLPALQEDAALKMDAILATSKK